MHRFRVSREELAAVRPLLRGAELRHLRDVLRVMPGERVELFDGGGKAMLAVVDSIGRTAAELTVVGPSERRSESPLAVTLAVGVAKGAKLDWIVEKTTELGVSRIAPFTSERTVPEPASFASKIARWRRIADAAAAQSGRSACPSIDDVVDFSTLLRGVATHDRAIVFWERQSEALAEPPGPVPASILVVTGPEGGFSAAEAGAAARAGCVLASLGPRTLRAETAAVVAVAYAQLRWGDLAGKPPGLV